MPSRFQGEMFQVLGLGTAAPITVALSTSTNLNATALTGTLRLVRLWASVDCFVKVGGSSVTAATTDHPLTAKIPEIFHLAASEYVAGIVSSGTGTLFISELS